MGSSFVIGCDCQTFLSCWTCTTNTSGTHFTCITSVVCCCVGLSKWPWLLPSTTFLSSFSPSKRLSSHSLVLHLLFLQEGWKRIHSFVTGSGPLLLFLFPSSSLILFLLFLLFILRFPKTFFLSPVWCGMMFDVKGVSSCPLLFVSPLEKDLPFSFYEKWPWMVSILLWTGFTFLSGQFPKKVGIQRLTFWGERHHEREREEHVCQLRKRERERKHHTESGKKLLPLDQEDWKGLWSQSCPSLSFWSNRVNACLKKRTISISFSWFLFHFKASACLTFIQHKIRERRWNSSC